jgi:uncharacterized protein YpiB (UPF0302 family)
MFGKYSYEIVATIKKKSPEQIILKKTKNVFLDLTYVENPTDPQYIAGKTYNCFNPKDTSVTKATYSYELSKIAKENIGLSTLGNANN